MRLMDMLRPTRLYEDFDYDAEREELMLERRWAAKQRTLRRHPDYEPEEEEPCVADDGACAEHSAPAGA